MSDERSRFPLRSLPGEKVGREVDVKSEGGGVERYPVAEGRSPDRGGRPEEAREGEALSARTAPALSRRPHCYGFIAGNYAIYNIEAVVLINTRSSNIISNIV